MIASDLWLDDAIEELENDGYVPHQPETSSQPYSWDNAPWNPTHVTVRVLDYVREEFRAGAAGERWSLPSTYDVAVSCIRGAGNTKSCRLAMRHLRLLEMVGEIIRVHDPAVAEEDGIPLRHCTYWALPNSGLMAEDNDEPEPQEPLNRYGFTDERWAAMKPWQRNLIRDIERAELVSDSD
ncbi:hypothetical protein [Streptomyces werraensis]|uniref:hypothetical protein n=1 Tax=Streptomyces werraensis TaxID=68284 RepID=UPI0037FA9D74